MSSARNICIMIIIPADIEEEFVSAPVDTSAYYEDEAQLICQPPEGSPPPTVRVLFFFCLSLVSVFLFALL